MEDFKKAQVLDPGWREPTEQKIKLITYLTQTQELAKTKVRGEDNGMKWRDVWKQMIKIHLKQNLS